MKKYLLFSILFFIATNTYSQLILQYRACLNCDNTYPVLNWQAQDVSSDYGMRKVDPGKSKWHRGIDFGKSGATDYGYHLISPVDGTVKQIFDKYSTYKILSIQDNLGNNYNFGYGHIFNNTIPSTNSPVVLGDFVLYKFLYSGDYHFTIINTLTNVAISDIDGYSFTYPSTGGQSYTTTNQVTAGQEVAPLGGSGGFMGGAQHLHLYRFVDANINNITSIQDKDNCKDPLQILDHVYTYYSTDIETKNLTLSGNNTYFSGANKSIIKVRKIMVNPDQQGSYPNYYYNNAIMDIDDVDVKIKKVSEDYTAYSLIHGKNYLSKISHGARWGGNPYPNTGTDKIRDAYGVYSTNANSCEIGIIPGAYALSGAYDDFVFTDFYTRIHKDHNLNGTLTLAENPDDALYSDGKYNIKADITTVKGSQQNSLSPIEIIIDNFRPYIKEVAVFKTFLTTDTNNLNLVYRGKWKAIGSSLNCSIDGTRYSPSGIGLIIKVKSSEALQDIPSNELKLDIEIEGETNTIELLPYEVNAEKTEFLFKLTASQTNNINDAVTKKVQLNFTGQDLAGNQLEAFINTGLYSQIPTYQVKIRQDANTWQPEANPGTDSFHYFLFGCQGYKTTEDDECLRADFYADETVINSGEAVHIYNNSVGNITNFNYHIQGPGANYTTSEENFSKVLNIVGYYSVELTVFNDESENTMFKEQYIRVIDDSSEDIGPDFYAYPKTVFVGEPINLYDLSYNEPTYWKWYASSSTPFSTEQNPTYSFDTEGIKDIRLSVSNDNINWEDIWKFDYITVVSPSSSSINCEVDETSLINSTCSFYTEIINAAYNSNIQYTYVIDFGDGTPNHEFTSSQLSDYITHIYNSSGTKTYNIIVYNQNGNQIGNCTGTIQVYDINAPIMAQIVMNNSNPVMGEMVEFSANTDAIGQAFYTWTVENNNGNIIDGGSNETFEKAFNPGEYTINLVIYNDETNRPAGNASKTLIIEEPNNCMSVSLIHPQCITIHTYKTLNCNILTPNECEAYIDGHRLDEVTDIRWTYVCRDCNSGYQEHYSIIDGNFSTSFEIYANYGYQDIYVEVWNRYAHPEILYTELYNCSGFFNYNCEFNINKYDKDYYDRKHYFFKPGNSNIGTNIRYISYDSNNLWYGSRSFDEEIIKTVDGNYIHSGDDAYYKASNYIALRNGFTAENGCDFTAKVTGCGAGFEFYIFNHSNEGGTKSTDLKDISLSIFPNPTTGIFTAVIKNIEDENSKLIIYDLWGKILFTKSNLGLINKININNCEPGIYFVKLIHKNKILTKKLIISKQ